MCPKWVWWLTPLMTDPQSIRGTFILEPPQSRAAVGRHVFHIFWEGFYFIWHESQHGSIFTVITHVLCHRGTSETLKRWHLHICVASIRDEVNYTHMPAILSARAHLFVCASHQFFKQAYLRPLSRQGPRSHKRTGFSQRVPLGGVCMNMWRGLDSMWTSL